ncbi:MAG: amidohydrolase family protein, partial [Planctomycetes bacterium]|nr:amidohydrolase family protein [Planctomycetota bacterium]
MRPIAAEETPEEPANPHLARVAEPPESLGLDPFYKKHVGVGGFPVVSSARVSDYALLEAAYLIDRMLVNRPDIRKALIDNKVRFSVMAYNERTTDVPEHSDLTPAKFWDRRARGLGATPIRPSVSCGEENLLRYPGDPYHKENILIHEFAHAIHHMGLDTIDKEFDRKLKKLYDEAMAAGRWKGKYAAGNRAEYWAEAVQSWFDTNRPPDHDHNHVDTREELEAYDPGLAALVAETLGPIKWRYRIPRLRKKAEHLEGYDRDKAPSFAWSAELVRWYQAYEAREKKPAHLVLRGGKIVTVDPELPEATALAVHGDKIVAVGSDEAMKEWIGDNTKVIDLQGKLALPGFIESHGHFLSLGESLRGLDLSKARTWDEVVAAVAKTAEKTPPGQWVEGRGWHQAKWEKPAEPNVNGYPTHEKLSRAVPNHPVVLYHASGHGCIANAAAMKAAGVDKKTPDLPGGVILRDRDGNPTGVFLEMASGLIGRALRGGADEFDEAVRLASDECLRHGVTTFQDAGSSLRTIARFRRLAEAGELDVRLWVMIREPYAVLARHLHEFPVVRLGNHHLTVRSVKQFMDGALGTHGAWLLSPYDDLPGNTGQSVTTPGALRRVAELALKHDLQLCVHAIGDRANR